MIQRLYYDDAYLRRFEARIIERGCDPCEVYLDRTAFYPTSGGQPYDRGEIDGISVIDVIEDGDRIQHRLARPVNQDDVTCSIDWERRFDHMQQHTGQHLLSAVLDTRFDAPTVGFHMGRDVSTLDVGTATLSNRQIRETEDEVNRLIGDNLPVHVGYEDAAEADGLRRATERSGTLRIVSIGELDRSACGGTHVRSTAEIGGLLIRKLDKVRGNLRIEFLCGHRALRRARADFDALTEVARVYSGALDEAPSLAAAQQARLTVAEKARTRLARELAAMQGRELHRQTVPGGDGIRRHVRTIQQGPISDELRAEAQSFTSEPSSLFLALVEDPPSLLLAVSKDAGMHAGDLIKQAVSEVGGRGGGNAQIAQGSLPDKDALASCRRHLKAEN